MTRLRWIMIGVALGALGWPEGPALGQGPGKKFGELLKRVPEQANVLLLVDVDGLLDSPLGRREKWRDRAADRPAGALGTPADASKLAVAAGVDLGSLEERWKIGMLQARTGPPKLSVLASREGGYVEQLEAHNVAWTPRNFYLLSFPDRIVGFAAPADRQLLGEWIRMTLVRPRSSPPGWAGRAVFRAEAGSQVVLALNLAQAIAPKGAEVWLNDVEAVKKRKLIPNLVASALSRVESAFLQVDVKEAIQGSIRVDFESGADTIRPVAKELILAALEDHGALLGDLKSWTPEPKGDSITLTGRLSEDSLRRILAVASAPRLSAAADSEQNAPEAEADEPSKPERPATPPSREDGLKASQRYFRAVVDIAESLKTQKIESHKSLKLWYDRSAKQIEELPLLGVDTELLGWGSKVARSLREMAYGINYAAKDQTYRIAGTANGYYGGYGGSRDLDAAVVKRQSNATLDVELDGRWQVIETAIADMRRTMVEKYKVDF